MQTIFVFAKCDLGSTYDAAAYLVDHVEHISEVYSISGKYDLLIKIYLPDGTDAGHFVNQAIHTVPHIRDTQTLMTFKAFS